MTQPSRTTETINRDHAAIREVMLQARNLTVPDRATLAVGLVGHLATLMNRSQMSKLLDELREEAERVQDVPPARQRDTPSDALDEAAPRRQSQSNTAVEPRGEVADPSRAMRASDTQAQRGVGQAGRGEFRPDEVV